MLNIRSALSRAATPILLRFSGLRSNSIVFSASVATSVGSNRNPVSPSTTASGFPPTLVAITGLPEAIASRITFEKPSRSEHRIEMSPALSKASVSPLAPKKKHFAEFRALAPFARDCFSAVRNRSAGMPSSGTLEEFAVSRLEERHGF